MNIQADLGTQRSLEGQDIISEGKIVTRSLGADILGRFSRQTTSVSTEKRRQILFQVWAQKQNWNTQQGTKEFSLLISAHCSSTILYYLESMLTCSADSQLLFPPLNLVDLKNLHV